MSFSNTTCCVFQARHCLRSTQDIPCVPRTTFRVFHARYFVYSNQDISCVPSRTFRVFQAGHFLYSHQDTENRRKIKKKIVEIGAILAIFEPFEGWKIHAPLFGEFSRSSRDLIDQIAKMLGGAAEITKNGMQTFGSSNSSKIARMAPISTIF